MVIPQTRSHLRYRPLNQCICMLILFCVCVRTTASAKTLALILGVNSCLLTHRIGMDTACCGDRVDLQVITSCDNVWLSLSQSRCSFCCQYIWPCINLWLVLVTTTLLSKVLTCLGGSLIALERVVKIVLQQICCWSEALLPTIFNSVGNLSSKNRFLI